MYTPDFIPMQSTHEHKEKCSNINFSIFDHVLNAWCSGRLLLEDYAQLHSAHDIQDDP